MNAARRTPAPTSARMRDGVGHRGEFAEQLLRGRRTPPCPWRASGPATRAPPPAAGVRVGERQRRAPRSLDLGHADLDAEAHDRADRPSWWMLTLQSMPGGAMACTNDALIAEAERGHALVARRRLSPCDMIECDAAASVLAGPPGRWP